MAKDKKDVKVDEEEAVEGQQTLQTPYGVQDMNAAVEPEAFEDGIDGDVERVLTDEVHVDMGRGALTFKPGDKITIRNGHIVAATTREGMEYEFTPAHELHAEERHSAVDAENLHQNLSAAPHSTPDAPASPAPDPVESIQLSHEGTGNYEETHDAITHQPASGFEQGLRAEEDATPISDEEMPAANPEGDTAGFPEVPAVGSSIPQEDVSAPGGAAPQAEPGPGKQQPDDDDTDQREEPFEDKSGDTKPFEQPRTDGGKFAPKED